MKSMYTRFIQIVCVKVEEAIKIYKRKLHGIALTNIFSRRYCQEKFWN